MQMLGRARNHLLSAALSVAWAFPGGQAAGQDVHFFRHFHTADGLPDREVNRIVEDSIGFIWVGTSDGLARFDGREWRVFRHQQGDPRSVCGNTITALVAGNAPGSVWVGTDDGRICTWLPDRQAFVQVPLPDTLAGNGRILDLLPLSDASLLISVEKLGLHRLDLSKHRSEAVNADQHKLRDRIFDLCLVNGEVYLGTLNAGLMRLRDREAHELSHIRSPFSVPGQTIACIHPVGTSTLWMGAWDNGLYRHILGSDTVIRVATLDHAPLSHTGEEITAITWAHGRLWLGTKRSGLHLLDTATLRFTRHEHRFPDRASLASNAIRCLLTDSRGMVWIGTDNGLDLFDSQANHFRTHWLGGSITNSDLDDRVTGIARAPQGLVVTTVKQMRMQDARGGWRTDGSAGVAYHSLALTSTGQLLIGTNKGLDERRSDGRPVDAIRGVSAGALEATRGDAPFLLPSSRINAIAEARVLGRPVWLLSVFGYGVGVLDQATRQGFIEQVLLNDAPFENMFNGFFIDGQRRIWLWGRNSGLARGLHFANEARARALLDGRIPCRGNCSVGGYLGMAAEAHYGGPLAPKSITGMIEADTGSFYIATSDRGLLRFNPASTTLFTPVASLHNKLEGLARDTKGRLWCVAAGGFDVYDPDRGTWLRIDATDGLPEKGVQGAIHVLTPDTFAVGGHGCIVRFAPLDFRFPVAPPTVRLTHFRLFGKDADSLLGTAPIRLHHSQNFLSIAFTSFAYGSADKHRYHWQLLGVDPGPVDGGTRTEATYTNLKGGDLRFRVWAVNSAGIASEPVELSIVIVPPFWERWWFLALLAALVVAIAYAAYRQRIGRLHRIQQVRLSAEIAAQEKERERIARDLHDDLGTRISTLKLYMGSLRKQLPAGSTAHEVEQNARELLDESMKELRHMLHDLSPETVARYGLVKALEDLLMRVDKSRLIRTSFRSTGAEPDLRPDHALALYRIVQELVNNSIRHSSCARIDVRILHRDGRLELLYEDDGRGMDLNAHRTGHGFNNIQNRLQLIGGTITWDSAPDQGLRAIIQLIP
jgi:signal transduction histidine kinase/ligand-binding sensor domain-containing protein